MKNKFIYISLLLGVSSTFFLSCGDSTANSGGQAKPKATPMAVTTIPQKNVTSYMTYPTTIEGKVNSEVRAKVSGYIQQVLVDEGERVRKGQPLFKLETQSLSQDAAAAKANVNAAQVEVDKLIPLVKKGIISNVQLQTAKAKLEQAKSGYNSIAANIGYATVKSPVNGFVGSISYREGSLVSSTSTKPLTTVSDIQQVYANFSMNERDYINFLQKTEGKNLNEKLKNFPNVKLILANGEEYAQSGVIETVTGQIDPNTGTVSFRAVFNNPNQLITNGNSGTIKVPTKYIDALVVPQTATFEQQGQTFVYKVNNENLAISTLINIKDTSNNLFIVDSGVSAGDKIVVKGIGKLRNKTTIIPQEVAFDSIAKPIQTLFQ
jgi:membrane fusion protein (multidrug efflux system)